MHERDLIEVPLSLLAELTPASEGQSAGLRRFGIDPRGMSEADAREALGRARALHRRRRTRAAPATVTPAQREKARKVIERHPDLASLMDGDTDDCESYRWALSRLIRRARVREQMDALGMGALAKSVTNGG